jgi:hypothetical protein
MPGAWPGVGACYAALDPAARWRSDVGWEAWGEQLLARALVAPRLRPEELWLLGEDLGPAVVAYLRRIGVFADPSQPAYPPQLHDLLRRMTRRGGRSPAEWLADPADKFNANARILVPEWFARDDEAAAAAPPLYTNDPALLDQVT